MNDRWRLINRIDPLLMCTIPCEYEWGKMKIYRKLIFVRKSRLEETREKYGDNLEVLYGYF